MGAAEGTIRGIVFVIATELVESGVITTYQIRTGPGPEGLIFGSTDIDEALEYLRAAATGAERV